MLRVEGLPRVDERLLAGPTAVTVGVFDGMHRGHQALIARLCSVAQQRQASTVVLTFRTHPDAYLRGTAPAPLMSLDNRLEGLERAGVDACFVLDFDRSLMEMSAARFYDEVLIGGLGCVALVFGYDAAICRQREGTVERFRELGLDAERIDRLVVDGRAVSASAIREALGQGDLATATTMLGRPYSLRGLVVHGAARGRRIGFRTANVVVPDLCPPASGVYAVRATARDRGLDGADAVVNLGTRPTFGASEQSLEVHVLDRDDLDLYGVELQVDFLARIRAEQKFASEAALTRQIQEDVATARTWLARA